ncbi:hypothetical protein [Chitinophaga japonensis]|uniref:Uncharacterized protein n=1 Tax=Chitinophaga japonensis TaxID=104662 RepID=A0A562T4R8_CHIJA|nr:hypothetical protein [Chitinophaga japonensis]TWI88234.1 hypothetical protein LX66_2317 [Chitinophaga japonensis]
MTTNMQIYKRGTGNCWCLEREETATPPWWRSLTEQQAASRLVEQHDGRQENSQEITDRFSQDDLVGILAQYLF